LTGAAQGGNRVYERPWLCSETEVLYLLSSGFPAILLLRKLAILKYISFSKPHKPLAAFAWVKTP
jgi:hypothetical protein